MSGPYQGRDLSNCGVGRLRVAINCGVLSVKAITREKAKKLKKEEEFDKALDAKGGAQPKCVVDAEEGSRKEEPREVESEDIAESEMIEDAQGGERLELSKEDAKDDVEAEEYEDGIEICGE